MLGLDQDELVGEALDKGWSFDEISEFDDDDWFDFVMENFVEQEAYTYDLTIGEVLGYVNQLLVDWHVMPFIVAGFIVMVVTGTIVLIRRVWLGS